VGISFTMTRLCSSNGTPSPFALRPQPPGGSSLCTPPTNARSSLAQRVLVADAGTRATGRARADYVMLYQDGTQERAPIRRRRQIGAFQRRWGENCFEAVAHSKPRPVRARTSNCARLGVDPDAHRPGGRCPVDELAVGVGEPASRQGARRRAL